VIFFFIFCSWIVQIFLVLINVVQPDLENSFGKFLFDPQIKKLKLIRQASGSSKNYHSTINFCVNP
jgi:hypothetical protein